MHRLSFGYLICLTAVPLRLTGGFRTDEQHALAPEPELTRSAISFSDDWQVLGPFQIGTRGKITDD
jgi:hypothetical protein